jgi:hypothetical protein
MILKELKVLEVYGRAVEPNSVVPAHQIGAHGLHDMARVPAGKPARALRGSQPFLTSFSSQKPFVPGWPENRFTPDPREPSF